MPTLPNVSRESLSAAAPGSLVSVSVPKGDQMQTVLGLRVWTKPERGDPREPAFVALEPGGEGRVAATLVVARRPGDYQIDGRTRVVNHRDAWAFRVEAKDWMAEFQMNFAPEHSGLLLASEVAQGNGLRLAVHAPYAGACHLLHFDDWILNPMAPGQPLIYAAARKWKLLLPSVGPDPQWLP
jgi:hypothetical protein